MGSIEGQEPARSQSGPSLLTIEGDYSLHVVQERQLQHEVFSRSAGGWFAHVWHVNPLVGADPHEPAASSSGPPSVSLLAPGHTVVEGHVAISERLRLVPPLNLLLAQISLMLKLSRIMRKEKISIVRAGDPYYLGLLAFLLSRLHNTPLVIKVAANYDATYAAAGKPAYPRLLRSRRLEKRIERMVLKRADLVAAANSNNLDYVLANGASPERSTIFRYGSWVDPTHFEEPRDDGSLFAALGIPSSKLAVLVSRLEPVKHPEDALLATAEARARGADVRLVMIGDGSMRMELEMLAERLGIKDRTHFVGARHQEDVRAALRESSVILAPLAGRALVEAALSGRPVIAYDVEWHSELIDEESGVLVPYRDAAAMGRAIAALIEDEELATGLGRRGRAKCLEMMDPQKLAAHERLSYQKVLNAS